MKLFCHLDVGVGVGVHFKGHDMGKVLLDELSSKHTHWLGAYRTNALYSGHIFVRFNDLEDVFT